MLVRMISARRRRRSGLKPIRGTAWLAPKDRFSPHPAMPGPPGPAGYYPPPPPPGHGYSAPHGTFYGPPPYTVNPQHTGTTGTNSDAYYAPPPGPPAAHAVGQSFEMAPQNRMPYGGPPPVPVSSHPTGASTNSYVQSNNPFQPPVSLPVAHVADAHSSGKH